MIPAFFLAASCLVVNFAPALKAQEDLNSCAFECIIMQAELWVAHRMLSNFVCCMAHTTCKRDVLCAEATHIRTCACQTRASSISSNCAAAACLCARCIAVARPVSLMHAALCFPAGIKPMLPAIVLVLALLCGSLETWSPTSSYPQAPLRSTTTDNW